MSSRRSFAVAASCFFASVLAGSAAAQAPAAALSREIDARLQAVQPKLIEWRRHLHANPELGNREVETAKFVAERLRAMGLQPRTGIARTGVVALIEGGKPGPVVALRADMDALPVTEEVDLPFASKATASWEGKTVGVMHACGHDGHVATLLAAAEALVAVKAQLPGKVLLVFQPAEESVPIEEQPAGAELMLKEGLFADPKPDAVFGLHYFARVPTGVIGYRSGPLLASADRFEIVVHGRQAHGSAPWAGIDPITIGAEMVGAIQTIVSRTQNITKEPAVVTVGQFEAGVRNNIIPDRARLVGTIRTFDEAMRDDIHARLRRIAENVAEAHGAKVDVRIERGYPVTANQAELTQRMLPTLQRVAPVVELPKVTGAEDFSFYANAVPGLFVIVGVTPKDQVETAASNHSPRFFLDEAALPTGARALAHLAADFLTARPAKR